MFARFREVVDEVREVSAGLEPECLHGSDAARMLEAVSELEKLCASMRTRLARRVETSNHWRTRGHRHAGQLVARTTGVKPGQALSMLETGKRLEQLPETREAFARGELSEHQARVVAEGASADPAAEARLLETARTKPVKALEDECRAAKAAAESAAQARARLERIHRGRHLRSWTDGDGASVVTLRATPTQMAPLLAAVEAETRAVFERARGEGRRERREAYALDALASLVAKGASGDGEGSGPSVSVHVLVDEEAARRGHTEAGETCEIDGVGPVPVAAVKGLFPEARFTAVTTDGIDVFSLARLGVREGLPSSWELHEALATKAIEVQALSSDTRHVPEALADALVVRDRTCVVPGCGARLLLERDHYVVDFAERGPTAYWNLARLCPHHHRLKTHRGYRLEGGPGAWRWLHPDGTVETSGSREAVPAGVGGRPPP